MRFKIDENLPELVAGMLRDAGHDACAVYDQDMQGGKDPRLAEVCRLEKRALVTLDRGFGDIRAFQPKAFSGIILLRPPRQDLISIRHVVGLVITQLETADVDETLWVAGPTVLRVRINPE